MIFFWIGYMILYLNLASQFDHYNQPCFGYPKKKNLASHHYSTNIVISNKINILLLPFFFFLYRINILILPSSFFSFIELTFFFHYMCHVCVVSPSMTLTVFFHYRTQLMLVDLLRESSTTLMDYQI